MTPYDGLASSSQGLAPLQDADAMERSFVKPIRLVEMGPLMFLSLFLLLLAFFILLNAISTLEETKSRAVISSVAATFQTDIVPDNEAEILISTLGPVPQPDEVTADIERLWVTAIPIAKIETVTPGRVLQVSVPAMQIFVGGQSEVRADRRDLLRATAHALASRLEGLSVQLRMTIPVDDMRSLRSLDPTLSSEEGDSAPSVEEVLADDQIRTQIAARIESGASALTLEAVDVATDALSSAALEGGSGLNSGSGGGLGDAVETVENALEAQETAQNGVEGRGDEGGGVQALDEQNGLRAADAAESRALVVRPDGTVEQFDPITGQTIFIPQEELQVPEEERAAIDPSYLPFARAASFAAALVEAGAPPDGVSVGVAEGQSGRLRMRFDLMDERRAFVTFNAVESEADDEGQQ